MLVEEAVKTGGEGQSGGDVMGELVDVLLEDDPEGISSVADSLTVLPSSVG